MAVLDAEESVAATEVLAARAVVVGEGARDKGWERHGASLETETFHVATAQDQVVEGRQDPEGQAHW